MKLLTETDIIPLETPLRLTDRITLLGSCFTGSIGERMHAAGFKTSVNPFGQLYNPESILAALKRLNSGTPFNENDCVEMGAGAGLICSFSHHTSFARRTPSEFLENANRSLEEASAFWNDSTVLAVTIGTAFVWRKKDNGEVVSNCLKRPGSEFERKMMSPEEVRTAIKGIISEAGDRKIIFSVSPIRHLGQGAHENTKSKAALHLGIGDNGYYFPSYEIMMDELRDYRFYSDRDLCHPSDLAVRIIWEKFKSAAVSSLDYEAMDANERNFLRNRHTDILKK